MSIAHGVPWMLEEPQGEPISGYNHYCGLKQKHLKVKGKHFKIKKNHLSFLASPTNNFL